MGFTINYCTTPGRRKRNRKCCHGVDSQLKELQYILSILESRISKDVEEIPQSHKIHHKNHEKLEILIDNMRKNLSKDENPEIHL